MPGDIDDDRLAHRLAALRGAGAARQNRHALVERNSEGGCCISLVDGDDQIEASVE
jgi:hypothetical protein